jgi:hypothetical protein
VVYDRCSVVVSLIAKFLSGRSVPFDVSQLAASVVEVSGGRYVCRLCGRVFRLSGLRFHLQRRHCSELVELWSELRPQALFRGGGGRPSFMPFVFMCRNCGWSLRLDLPCNAGPPSVKRKLSELLGTVIPRCCPKCGRVFDVGRLEFGFVGEREGV